MKIFPALPAVVFLVCASALADAQTPPPPRRIIQRSLPEVPPPPTPAPAPVPTARNEKFTRFDLDFPGGTPADLAAAISKATGKHLNLIIPTEQANVRIMPMKVERVNVPELFNAIMRASAHRLPVRYRSGNSENVEYYDVVMSFRSDVATGDEAIWSFSCNQPTVEEMAVRYPVTTPVPSVCRYFQLAPYLENYSIEDITTAIQTGWKMAKVEPLPQLSFHRETRLLIAVGPEASVNLIPAVLGELQKDRAPVIEKMVKLEAEIDAAKDDQAKANILVGKLKQLASQQKANEQIDNPAKILFFPERDH